MICVRVQGEQLGTVRASKEVVDDVFPWAAVRKISPWNVSEFWRARRPVIGWNQLARFNQLFATANPSGEVSRKTNLYYSEVAALFARH